MNNCEYSQKLEDLINSVDPGLLYEACDLTSTDGYDTDGSTSPELVDNGVGLGMRCSKGDEVFYASHSNENANMCCYMIGKSEDDACARLRAALEEETGTDVLAKAGLRVLVVGEMGSRDIDLKVTDIASGEQVFWGGGFFDGDQDEWLSVEIHDTTMLKHIEEAAEKETVAKQVVMGLVLESGTVFANVQELIEAVKDVKVY